MITKLILCLILIGCEKDSGANPDVLLPEQSDRMIELQGFKIRVVTDFIWNQETDNAYRYLGKVLDEMKTVLPAPALKRMQEKDLWLTMDGDSAPTVEYYTKEGERAGCVIINDITEFYRQSVTNRPFLLTHYLALQYADRFLKPHGDLLSTAWEKAVSSGRYESVDYFDGKKVITAKAEAIANPSAYFAELSEAYWGKNDFFPFDYHDMEAFDSDGFRLMEEIWGKRRIGEYHRYRICGYDVMVLASNVANPLTEEALANLEVKLQEINTLLPEVFTNFFKRRKIWMEIGSGSTIGGAAEYHPSREWLVDNGRFIEKYNCVEIGNMRNFIDWMKKNQPMMILHELSHYYHKSCLDGNISILSAYETARNSKKYDEVDYFDGSGIYKQKAYSMTDAMEYFAELTESFFGKNDYYPFQKEELKAFDSTGFKVIETLWNPLNFKE